ncbi:MAG: tetratricopeptide repeat protein [Leifsonia sp.]
MTADTGDRERAAVYLDADRPQDALRLLGPYLASAPEDVRALCLYARALVHAGDARRGVETARRAVSLAPDGEWAWRVLAFAESQAGNHQAAVGAAARARAIAPMNWLTHLQVATVELKARTVTPDTLAAALRAVEMAPDEAIAHYTVGNVLLAQKAPKDAEQAFRRALALDPHMTSAQNNLAIASMHQGATGVAAAGFVDILAANPASDLARRNVLAAIGATVARLRILLGAGVLASFALRNASLSADGADSFASAIDVRLATIVVVLVIGIGWTVLAIRFVAGAGIRMKQILRAAWRFDRWICWIALLALVVYGSLIVAAVLQEPASGGGATAAVLCYAVLLLCTFVRRSRRR